MTRMCVLSLAALSLIAPFLSVAQTKAVATFSGLKNLEFVNDYYDGGLGSLGSGPGPSLGLQFTPNAQAIVSASKGGSGNFINDPGNYPVMFFQTGNGVVINATNRISLGLWFFYSALQPGTVTVYDGANGTGNILASITLAPNNTGCNTYKMCVWSPVGVPLATSAGSIRFLGTADYLAIGSIHMGSVLPTSTTLISSQNPSVQGEAVTFTATVSAIGAVPAGSVTFRSGSKVIGVVVAPGGTAAVTSSSLPVGSTRITAIFQGTGFAKSSAYVIQTVN